MKSRIFCGSNDEKFANDNQQLLVSVRSSAVRYVAGAVRKTRRIPSGGR